MPDEPDDLTMLSDPTLWPNGVDTKVCFLKRPKDGGWPDLGAVAALREDDGRWLVQFTPGWNPREGGPSKEQQVHTVMAFAPALAQLLIDAGWVVD